MNKNIPGEIPPGCYWSRRIRNNKSLLSREYLPHEPRQILRPFRNIIGGGKFLPGSGIAVGAADGWDAAVGGAFHIKDPVADHDRRAGVFLH